MKMLIRGSFIILNIVTVLSMLSCNKFQKIKDTVIENISKEWELPKYSLKENTYDEITLNNKTYKITDEKVAIKNINNPIGKISSRFTLDESKKKLTKEQLRKFKLKGTKTNEKRYYLNFGWIYDIKGLDIEKEIAVSINEYYYKAVIIK